MSSLLIVLLVIGAVAVLVASAALVSMLQRRDVLLRATDDQAFEGASVVLRPEKAQALRQRLHVWRKEVGAQMPAPNPQHDPSRPEHTPPTAKKKSAS